MKKMKKNRTMDEALLFNGVQVRNAKEAKKLIKPVQNRKLKAPCCA